MKKKKTMMHHMYDGMHHPNGGVNYLGTPESYTKMVNEKTEEYVEKRNKRRKMVKGKIAEMKKKRKMMPHYL